MKIIIVSILALAVAATCFGLSISFRKITELETKIEKLETQGDLQANAIRDYCTNQINKVQDSVEERIGDLERDVNDIKFIQGEKKHAVSKKAR